MKKMLNLALFFPLVFVMTACGQSEPNETGTAGNTGQNSVMEFMGDEQKAESASFDKDRETNADKEPGAKAEFHFETKTVMLNSGYEMPVNGLGTYSLHGDECINSVKSALSSGVCLIDTASAYGNEAEVGQAVREAIDEGIIEREDVFITTKIYPGSEMENPEQSIQECLDRLNIEYVDLMLLHHPDPNDVEAYKAMEQFVKEGKSAPSDYLTGM